MYSGFIKLISNLNNRFDLNKNKCEIIKIQRGEQIYFLIY